MNSHNHPALTSIGAWFWRWLAGIRIAEEPGEPGYGCAYAHLTLAPYAALVTDHARISAAHAKLPTSHGVVELSWEFADGKLHLNTTLPPNTAGTVKLPSAQGRGWVELTESGTALWRGGASLLGEAEVAVVFAVGEADQDHVQLSIGSGRFSFVATLGEP